VLLHVTVRNTPRIWRDFGSALPFQTRPTHTKPVLPLPNEHGSQVNYEGRWDCCHTKQKSFPIGLHVMYLFSPDTRVHSVCSGAVGRVGGVVRRAGINAQFDVTVRRETVL
jgi:hypothetical protein